MEKNIKKIEDMSLNAWPLNSLAVQPYHGEKRSPTAKTFTNALAHLRSSRSVLWSHRILTILWRTVDMRSSIQQKS